MNDARSYSNEQWADFKKMRQITLFLILGENILSIEQRIHFRIHILIKPSFQIVNCSLL